MVSKHLKNVTMDNNSNVFETYENIVSKKKSFLKASFSGVKTKSSSFRFNTSPKGMKPLDLLEELHKICSDESLTKDDKNIKIRKMLEREP